jgi:hypothetical protein
MTDVSLVRSLAERLAKIAADCFDLRAAQRLRELAGELTEPNRNDNPQEEAGPRPN